MSTQTGTETAERIEPFEEVQRLVERAIAEAGGQYHTGLLAIELREQIRLEYPEVWGAWVEMMATDALKTAIGRAQAMHRRPNSRFSHSGYDITEEVDNSHTQRRFGEMTRPDLHFVARRYSRHAKTLDLRAKRVRALRDRLPDDTTKVRDVIPEPEVAAIFDN